SLTETKWWYKGPDGESHGPYLARQMSAWGPPLETLPVRTEKDEEFHSAGEWRTVMGGVNPFASSSVPAFNVL
ncbi:hypothetical protein PENTCL1PPCAC_5372, partial [Pristionchus entomophagus]